MAEGDTSVRFKPLWRVQPVDGYDLDSVVLVFDRHANLVNFSLRLGRGLEMYSCAPAKRKDLESRYSDESLVLVHIDSAVSFVDEPTLVSDPCLAQMMETVWGELDLDGLYINAANGRHVLDSVKLSCTRGDYHLVVGLRDSHGRLRGEVMRNTEIPDD